MTNLDLYDVINVFAFASAYLAKEELNESQIETLQKFYDTCDKEQQTQLLDLFPEIVHTVS